MLVRITSVPLSATLTVAVVIALFAALPRASAEGPQITIEPASGDCSVRPVVRGTGFPANLHLEIADGSPASAGESPNLLVDIQFQSDANGNFAVTPGASFDTACRRHPAVLIVVGASQALASGQDPHLTPVSATFNPPSAPATGSGVHPSRMPDPLVLAGLATIAFATATTTLVLAEHRH